MQSFRASEATSTVSAKQHLDTAALGDGSDVRRSQQEQITASKNRLDPNLTPIGSRPLSSNAGSGSAIGASVEHLTRMPISGQMRDILGNVDADGWPVVENQSFLVSNVKDGRNEFDIQTDDNFLQNLSLDEQSLRDQLNSEAEAIMNKVLDYEKIQPLLDEKVYVLMMDDFEKAFKIVKEIKDLERVVADFKKMKLAVKSYRNSEEKLIESHKKLQSEHNHIMSKFRGMYRLSKHDRKALEDNRNRVAVLEDQLKEKQAELDAQKESVELMSKEASKMRNDIFIKNEEKKGLQGQIEELRAQISAITNYMESDALPPIIREKLREMELANEALQEQYNGLQERLEQAAAEKADLHNALIELRKELEAKKAEVTREEVNKKSVMRERDELHNQKTDLESKLKHGALNLKKTNEQLRETLSENQTFKIRNAELESQLKSQMDETNRIKNDKMQLQEDHNRLNCAHQNQSETLKTREKELSDARNRLGLLMKSVKDLEKKLRDSNDKVKQLTQRSEALRKERDSYIKDTQSLQSQLAQAKDQMKQVRHDGLATQKKLEDQMKLAADNRERIAELEREKRKRDDELNRLGEEKTRQELEIGKLEKLINNLKDEVSEIEKQAESYKQESNQKDMQLSDIQKKLSQQETRSRNSMKMFVDMRDDRDYYSNASSQLQNELKEKDKQVEKANADKEKMKTLLEKKDKVIETANKKVETLEKEKEELSIEIGKHKRKVNGLEALLKASDLKSEKLNRFLDRYEIAQKQKSRSVSKIVNDRDVIGRQLIDKQLEIRQVLREKDAAQCDLQRSQREVGAKNAEIQQLRQEIANLNREREILSRKAIKADDLQQELNLVNNELQKERARVSEVEMEQQTPINVHRWRLLKGKDPGMNETKQKLETYQDLLKKKNREIADKEKCLEDQKRMVEDLSVRLSKCAAGVDTQNEIAAYKRRLSKMSTEMKVETAHKNAFQSQLEKTQSEIEMLHDENRNWKQMYYDMKRKLSNQSFSVSDGTSYDISSSTASRKVTSISSYESSANLRRDSQNSSTVNLPVIQNALRAKN